MCVGRNASGRLRAAVGVEDVDDTLEDIERGESEVMRSEKERRKKERSDDKTRTNDRLVIPLYSCPRLSLCH